VWRQSQADHAGMVGRVLPPSLRIQKVGVWPRFITRVLPTYGRGREAVRKGTARQDNPISRGVAPIYYAGIAHVRPGPGGSA